VEAVMREPTTRRPSSRSPRLVSLRAALRSLQTALRWPPRVAWPWLWPSPLQSLRLWLRRWLRRSLWLAFAVLVALRATSLAAPAAASARDPADDGDDDARLDGPRVPVIGPPIASVLAAAYAAAGLDRDPSRSWTWRARVAGLVPWLTVRTARDTSWQDEHSEVGHGTSLEVRATWRLDRLVFDGHELQVSAIEAARRRERKRLATRVIRSYFAWRRAAGLVAGPDDDRVAARIAEPAAELDALTEGWFSEQVARLRQRPPEAASAH
jgi:hypothetical protein